MFRSLYSHVDVTAPSEILGRTQCDETSRDNFMQVSVDGVVVVCVCVDIDQTPPEWRIGTREADPAAALGSLDGMPAVGDRQREVGVGRCWVSEGFKGIRINAAKTIGGMGRLQVQFEYHICTKEERCVRERAPAGSRTANNLLREILACTINYIVEFLNKLNY